MVYSLLNVFGAEVNEELPLGNTSIIDEHGWFTNLHVMSRVTMSTLVEKADLFDYLFGNSLNLFPFRNVTFIASYIIWTKISDDATS